MSAAGTVPDSAGGRPLLRGGCGGTICGQTTMPWVAGDEGVPFGTIAVGEPKIGVVNGPSGLGEKVASARLERPVYVMEGGRCQSRRARLFHGRRGSMDDREARSQALGMGRARFLCHGEQPGHMQCNGHHCGWKGRRVLKKSGNRLGCIGRPDLSAYDLIFGEAPSRRYRAPGRWGNVYLGSGIGVDGGEHFRYPPFHSK